MNQLMKKPKIWFQQISLVSKKNRGKYGKAISLKRYSNIKPLTDVKDDTQMRNHMA
jgi:hypothetical protein